MSTPPGFLRSRSVRDDGQVDLLGPIDVDGSVKSGSGVTLTNDIIIREKLEAYGAIYINGSVSCGGRIKAYGNIIVRGYLSASDKIKGSGKLKIEGALEGRDLEIYGNVSIQGSLRLVVYGSLTLIGPEDQSWYYAEEPVQIAGPVIRRDQEADWDW
ncbi:hypothetical protein G7Z17_g10311 [Cylindrodendrum hubeiense]|uniref:Polymer-forming cytoskeletal protein n=1 Tax=Cylindrodendrum hubeiense TaxID=595255 RepID=A0A9P5L4X1_9HYPO|nr:hypothetical protein G7Z17_g10311 [Cylindrodendrum hubeiense]